MKPLACHRLRVLVVAAVVAVAAPCQANQSSIIILPTRDGSPPQSPELGPSLRHADVATCGKLRDQLAILVAAMSASLDEARSFWPSYQGDIELLREFDARWKNQFVSIKNKLFTMGTCEEFKAEWALALAAWRDVFRYEKLSVSDLSSDWINARSFAAVQLEANLRKLLTDLRQ